MKKVGWILFITGVLAVVWGVDPAAGQDQDNAGTDRPNILWISVEDISPLMGVYGDPVVETPVIDQLAAEGMMYSRAFATAGVCSPSRTAIITGMHQSSIGAHHHRPTHTGHNHKTISGRVSPWSARRLLPILLYRRPM
ncbi:MAG: sulfatase-like hydrolase/transferase [Balneolaceae bacterium]|nr:sulfatase-like hydrolase/transferase [Balneolaceae bacterium]